MDKTSEGHKLNWASAVALVSSVSIVCGTLIAIFSPVATQSKSQNTPNAPLIAKQVADFADIKEFLTDHSNEVRAIRRQLREISERVGNIEKFVIKVGP
jgi:sensor histidine kinase regulating citrate/malate metabolism